MALIPTGNDEDKRREETSLKKFDQIGEMMVCRDVHLKDTEPDAAENEPPPGWNEAHS